jgi:hypothetical protein
MITQYALTQIYQNKDMDDLSLDKMYNSYMLNAELHIFTYKNTIYKSKLKLFAIFGQRRFSSTVRFSDRRHFHQQIDSARAQLIIQRRSYLEWVQLEYANLLSQLFGVFGCFKWIFTHICSSLGEKFRFKKSDKFVDTVTLIGQL